MDILDIYEKVNLKYPLEQRRFFNYYNDTVAELIARHPLFTLKSGDNYKPIKSMEDDCQVRDLYIPAIVDNILFFAGQDESGAVLKQEFIRKAQDAYLHYWNKTAHHKHTKRARW